MNTREKNKSKVIIIKKLKNLVSHLIGVEKEMLLMLRHHVEKIQNFYALFNAT